MNTALTLLAEKMSHWTHERLSEWGISSDVIVYINMLCLFVIAVAVIYAALYLTKYIITFIFNKIATASRIKFFNFLVKNKFPIYVARLLPYTLIKAFVPIVFEGFPIWIEAAIVLVDIWLVIMVIHIVSSFIQSLMDVLALRPGFRDKPMRSYMQVISIILYLIGIVVLFSIITGKSPAVFFTAMGAASAVLLLMFQDSIKGFVASIQVTTNDMVRLGDWITVPKYGADGDVIEINLTTVKVQNFDKTITTMPTYALISDSFQNWRGMENSRGRRIKRSILIKQSSIRFVADEELPRFKKIQGLTKYIDDRQEEILRYNERIKADRSIAVNGRNLTNAGLFRRYTEWYLKNHPGTKKDFTMMVRQLSPTSTGIPFEIYVFTNTTNWIEYESIMADVFDHLIAAVSYFDLQIFEVESGGDVKQVKVIS